jgi:hypothetical protein
LTRGIDGRLAQKSENSDRQQGLGREETYSREEVSSFHTPTGKPGKAFGVPQACVSAIPHNRVIAGQLPLPSEMSIRYPYQGMKENQPASQGRKPIPQIIAPSHVNKFVPQNLIELVAVEVRD